MSRREGVREVERLGWMVFGLVCNIRGRGGSTSRRVCILQRRGGVLTAWEN